MKFKQIWNGKQGRARWILTSVQRWGSLSPRRLKIGGTNNAQLVECERVRKHVSSLIRQLPSDKFLTFLRMLKFYPGGVSLGCKCKHKENSAIAAHFVLITRQGGVLEAAKNKALARVEEWLSQQPRSPSQKQRTEIPREG